MNKTKLFLIAVLGTICSWLLIDTFLLKMSIIQFIVVEFIVGISHFIYNDVKRKLIT
jgi:hypothetical protein